MLLLLYLNILTAKLETNKEHLHPSQWSKASDNQPALHMISRDRPRKPGIDTEGIQIRPVSPSNVKDN